MATLSDDKTPLEKIQQLARVCDDFCQKVQQILHGIASINDNEIEPPPDGFLNARDAALDDTGRLLNDLGTLLTISCNAASKLEKQQAEAAATEEAAKRRWKAISGPLSKLELSPEAIALLPTSIALEFNVLPVAARSKKSGCQELFVRSDFIHRDDDSQHRFELRKKSGFGYCYVQHLPVDLDERDELTRLVRKYYAPKRLFGEIAIEMGIITPAQLDEALGKKATSMAHRPIGEILVRLGYISKPHIIDILAEQFHLRLVTADELLDIPPETAKLVDGSLATLYRVIPLGLKADERGWDILEVATACPQNTENFRNVERILEKQVCCAIASPEAISAALSKIYKVEPNTPPEPFHRLGASGPITHVDPPPGLEIGGNISIEDDPQSVSGPIPQDGGDDLPEPIADGPEKREIPGMDFSGLNPFGE